MRPLLVTVGPSSSRSGFGVVLGADTLGSPLDFILAGSFVRPSWGALSVLGRRVVGVLLLFVA